MRTDEGPLVSGYHAAEWLVWNWWRLLCEPRSASNGWDLAHCMASIGEGYVWPNITIWSDGLRTAIIPSPSSRPDAKPFRYIGGPATVIPSSIFADVLDSFIPKIIARLRLQNVSETNLDRLWSDVLVERADPEISRCRRLEALLGLDPDSNSEQVISELVKDAETLGEPVVDELAAESAQNRGQHVLSAAALWHIAEEQGAEVVTKDVLRPYGELKVLRGPDVPAWKVGETAARQIRSQEHLSAGLLSSAKLAEMAGASGDVLQPSSRGGSNVSFVFETSSKKARLVLRSKWATGRRFDLARLIADRLFSDGGIVYPATRANTYRQKAQRAFAAELLSPFGEVDDMVAGDFSEERKQEVADYFDVSPLTIDTLLRNHGLPRDAETYTAIA